ncbi:Holliday junction branch migration protein RuvA [Selenomonas sp. TAMA-11512]|uniref:Holliday junction branch migration protein RuvA n=1 Tax=Selenomonas sp. TAMA-11512 TaxID=3095337 RepID=UPI003093644C|nr:Holliday junction branch migration protein RuvA [Selenomonas sp. TAMA-11512]
MIGFLRGKVSHIAEDMCFLDVSGVGYRIFASSRTLSTLDIGKERQLFTHLAVREDAMILYGFTTKEEYDVFQSLIAVSGVGPKAALGILSSFSAAQLALAIQNKDVKRLTQAPGIGKKSAERLILELKDKLTGIAMPEEDGAVVKPSVDMAELSSPRDEALAALASFGYTREEAEPFLKKADAAATTEELIRMFLKQAAK